MCGCGRRQPIAPITPPPSFRSISRAVSPPTLNTSVMTWRVSPTLRCVRHDMYLDTSGSEAMRSNSGSASSRVGGRSVIRGPSRTSTRITPPSCIVAVAPEPVVDWIGMAIQFNHTIVACATGKNRHDSSPNCSACRRPRSSATSSRSDSATTPASTTPRSDPTRTFARSTTRSSCPRRSSTPSTDGSASAACSTGPTPEEAVPARSTTTTAAAGCTSRIPVGTTSRSSPGPMDRARTDPRREQFDTVTA